MSYPRGASACRSVSSFPGKPGIPGRGFASGNESTADSDEPPPAGGNRLAYPFPSRPGKPVTRKTIGGDRDLCELLEGNHGPGGPNDQFSPRKLQSGHAAARKGASVAGCFHDRGTSGIAADGSVSVGAVPGG